MAKQSEVGRVSPVCYSRRALRNFLSSPFGLGLSLPSPNLGYLATSFFNATMATTSSVAQGFQYATRSARDFFSMKTVSIDAWGSQTLALE